MLGSEKKYLKTKIKAKDVEKGLKHLSIKFAYNWFKQTTNNLK